MINRMRGIENIMIKEFIQKGIKKIEGGLKKNDPAEQGGRIGRKIFIQE